MSGCAVSSDGSLLSPSKIDFFNDPDDLEPITGPSVMSPKLPALTGSSSASTLENYFVSHDTHQPSVNTVGIRHTTRPLKPSARLREAADTLGNSTTTKKRKANNNELHRRVVRKVVTDSNDSDGTTDNDNSMPSPSAVMDTDPMVRDGTDTDEVQAAYDRTKAMGEADREVSHNLWMSRYLY
jgi:hypothetical protein